MIVRFLKKNLTKKQKLIIKNNFLYKLFSRSAGNIFFPIFMFKWYLSNYLLKPKTVKIDNITFSLTIVNWITHFRWYLFDKKEIEVRDYLKTYLKPHDLLFDIGANIGVFSIYSAKIQPTCKVISFEPEFSNLYLLKKNVQQNKLFNQISIFSVGISDSVGISKLHLSSYDSGAAVHTESSSNINQTDEGYNVVGQEGIMTSTIDFFCEAQNIIPNHIKIDTDGNESKILNGALNVLRNKNLKSIIIEMPTHNKNQLNECEEILMKSGFTIAFSERNRTKNEIWIKNSFK